MTILKDGEKFACKQCIQGHRVSTCHHEERPLIHVARKGRPVSQCVHCRGLRRSRQTHVRCECGEKRHSRNNSMETGSLGSDENPCQCAAGRKCTCALKKEATIGLSIPPATKERGPVKPHPIGRRSESAVPHFRSTFHSDAEISRLSPHLSPDFRGNATLGRHYPAAQRSVDSLPLFLNTPFVQPGALQNEQLLSPNSALLHGSPLHSPNMPSADGLRNFNVSLDQDVLARTLSPQNPKRYSMNDWSMMTFNAPGVHSFSPEMSAPAFVKAESSEGPFGTLDTRQWQDDWSGNVQSVPIHHRMRSVGDAGVMSQPELSTSSTGTVSDAGDMWHNDLAPYATRHPTITVDPSCCQRHPFDEVSNYSWTPASYHEPTPSEVHFPSEGVSMYSPDTVDELLQAQSYVNSKDFAYHQQFHGAAMIPQDLPDRSIGGWSTAPEAPLNAAFKFPSTDLFFPQPFVEPVSQPDWRQFDDVNFLDLDSNSPLTR